MGTFIQKETMAIAGTAKEVAFTLNRGTKQSVNEVWVSFPNSGESDFVQLFRTDSATTGAQRDDSNAASKNVLVAEGYLINGAIQLKTYGPASRAADMRTAGFRVRLDSAATGTAYLNIVYDFP